MKKMIVAFMGLLISLSSLEAAAANSRSGAVMLSSKGIVKAAPVKAGKISLIEEGFESATFPPTGWTTKDADGDTYDWGLPPATGWAIHTGTGVATSASWINPNAVTPDNWLITPAVSIPGDAGAGSNINYWVCAQDGAYAGEHYGVFISETNTDPASFTKLFEETMTAKGKAAGAWYERNVAIPASYAGKTVYIAFRHFSCTDMFFLNLDDVKVTTPSAGPAFAITPSTYSFGTVAVGATTAPKKFVISNLGAANLTIANGAIKLIGANAAEFALSNQNHAMDLASSATDSIFVTCTPTTAGAKTAQIEITDNMTKAVHTVDISCDAMAPSSSIVENFDALTPPASPAGWTIHGAYTKTYGIADFAHSPANFMAMTVDENQMSMVVLPAMTDVNRQIKLWARTSTSNGTPDGTKTLKYGVIENPADPATFTEKGTLTVNGAYEELTGLISGYTGTAKNIAFKLEDANFVMWDDLNVGELPTTPIFAVTPANAAFSGTQINTTTAPKTFTIKNDGVGTLTVNSIALGGADANQYVLNNNNSMPLNLTAGQSVTVDVSFAPTSVGNKVAKLTVDASAKVIHDVDLTGEAIDAAITTFPYTQNFDAGTTLPIGWLVEDLNNDGITWSVFANTTTPPAASAPNTMSISYGTDVKNDYFYTAPVAMVAGAKYVISFKYAARSASYMERMSVKVGNAPISTAMTTTIFDANNIIATTYQNGTGEFVAPTTGNYFFGFHAYSDADMWRIYVDDITIDKVNAIGDLALPLEVALHQNYPNPFNPTTTIKFATTDLGMVKLSVYNAKGEVVKVLRNEKMVAGNHSVSFDGSSLNSGVYFYKLETAGKTMTQKMLLVK